MLINHIYDFIGETGSSKRKRHRKASTEGGSQMRELHNAISGSGNTSEMGKVESWFHEDCISWMADIRLVGHVILGIFWPNQYYQFLVIYIYIYIYIYIAIHIERFRLRGCHNIIKEGPMLQMQASWKYSWLHCLRLPRTSTFSLHKSSTLGYR